MPNDNNTEVIEVRMHGGPFHGLVRTFAVPMGQYAANEAAGKLTLMKFTRKPDAPGDADRVVEYALKLNEHFRGYGDAYFVVDPKLMKEVGP